MQNKKINPSNIKYGFSEDKHFVLNNNVFCVLNYSLLKNHKNLDILETLDLYRHTFSSFPIKPVSSS